MMYIHKYQSINQSSKEKLNLNLEEFFTLKVKKSEFFTLNVVFQETVIFSIYCDIFV